MNSVAQDSRGWPFALICMFLGLLITLARIPFPGPTTSAISFLGWAIPLVGGVLALIYTKKPIRFPVLIWLPWFLAIVTYCLAGYSFEVLQRSFMLACPIIIGVAFSKIEVDEYLIVRVGKVYERLCISVIFGSILYFLLGEFIPDFDEFSRATVVINLSLAACWFAAKFATSARIRDLISWLIISVVPLALVMRMGSVAVALTLPFTLAIFSLKKRILSIAVIIIVGLAAFQMDAVQEKMFFTGSGTVWDAASSAIGAVIGDVDAISSDFRTNARQAMHAEIRSQLPDAYWFGHGANSVVEITRYYDLDHPHNDWLRLQYDYGVFGVGLFVLAIVLQVISAVRLARAPENRCNPASRFLLVGAGAFLPMSLFMFSDNILMYIAWFGNLQFAMLGLGYANLKREMNAHIIQFNSMFWRTGA